MPAEKVSMGSIDIGESLLEPIEYSTPIPGNQDQTRREREVETNGHLAVDAQQIPKLELAEHVLEEPPQYNAVTETPQSTASEEEVVVPDVNTCALGHSDPVDMETEKHKLLETFESDLLGKETSPENVSSEALPQDEASPEELAVSISPEDMREMGEEFVQELASAYSNSTFIETDV